MARLVLASSSPRRQEIMRTLGLDFVLQPADVVELPLPGEEPARTAERLAEAKASAAAVALKDVIVVAADTVVVVDDRILGKPASEDEARWMLRLLRHRPHRVITSVAVVNTPLQQRFVSSVVTTVWMRDYSEAEIEDYVKSGEPMDKAGAYAIQSRVIRLVEKIEGCYLNVVGLPACELIRGLAAAGYPVGEETEKKADELCPHLGQETRRGAD